MCLYDPFTLTKPEPLQKARATVLQSRPVGTDTLKRQKEISNNPEVLIIL